MDCTSYAVYCYICDEYVVNDSDSDCLTQLRLYCQEKSSTICDQENTSSIGSPPPAARRSRGRPKRSAAVLGSQSSASAAVPESKRGKAAKLAVGRPRGSSSSGNSRPKSVGLRNLGNTCFMNAVLQSLSNIQEFSGYIKQLPSLENCKPSRRLLRRVTRANPMDDALLVEELRKTLNALSQSKSAISPESLFTVIWKVVPRFRGYQQQDAHEFMRYLLDRLHEELLALLPLGGASSLSTSLSASASSSTASQFYYQPLAAGVRSSHTVVTMVFGGILQNEVTCLECRMESKKHDPYLDLSLDIPASFASKGNRSKDPDQVCRLEDCLKSFTDVEELEDTELYMCRSCNRRQRSTKKFWIRRLPNVLCLHLKRFRWSSFMRTKVETYVEFPIRGLNMNKYILNVHNTRDLGGSNDYDLAAVVVHHGSGAGSGHYTAYALNEGQWYHFNDSTVTACDVETVAKCKAYILFYVRRELKWTLPASAAAMKEAASNHHQH